MQKRKEKERKQKKKRKKSKRSISYSMCACLQNRCPTSGGTFRQETCTLDLKGPFGWTLASENRFIPQTGSAGSTTNCRDLFFELY